MLEGLLSFDEGLFLAINGAHAPWLDPVMWFASGKLTWLPFYALVVYLAWRHLGWQRTLWFLAGVAVVILLADQLSVHLFKNPVRRLRPSHAPGLEGMVHLPYGHRGGLYGFVSSHAANCFGVAVLVTRIIRTRWMAGLLWSWAVLVSYSRVYMGVHYPGDVLCGALFGVVVGLGVFLLLRLVYERFRSEGAPGLVPSARE